MEITLPTVAQPTEGPVVEVDAVVARAFWALGGLAVACALTWYAIGDGTSGVAHSRALVAAGVAAVFALLATLSVLVATIGTWQRINLRARALPTVGQPLPGQYSVQPGMTPPPSTPPSPHRRRGAGRATLVAAVTVGTLIFVGVTVIPMVTDAMDQQEATDAAAEKGPVPASRLSAAELDRLGQCFRWPEGPTVADPLGQVADPQGAGKISCSKPHGYEVIGVIETAGGNDYPGAMNVINANAAACRERLLDYLTPKGGTRPAKTSWGTYVVVPGKYIWTQGNRKIGCIAIPPRYGVNRTGTLRGAG